MRQWTALSVFFPERRETRGDLGLEAGGDLGLEAVAVIKCLG